MTTVVLGRAHLYRYFHHTTILWYGILPPTRSRGHQVLGAGWRICRPGDGNQRWRHPTTPQTLPRVPPVGGAWANFQDFFKSLLTLEMEDHTYWIKDACFYVVLSYCSFLNLFFGNLKVAFDRLRNLWLVPPKWSRLVQSARQGGSNGYKQIPQWP